MEHKAIKTYGYAILLFAVFVSFFVFVGPPLLSSNDWIDVFIGTSLLCSFPIIATMIGRRIYKLWSPEKKQ